MNDGPGSGVDLTTTLDTLEVSLGEIAIQGTPIHDGVGTITFTPFETLDVGLYTIQIKPTDFAGNPPEEFQPRQFQFNVVESLDDVLPEVTATGPEDRAIENALLQPSGWMTPGEWKSQEFRQNGDLPLIAGETWCMNAILTVSCRRWRKR